MLKFSAAVLAAGVMIGKVYFNSLIIGLVISLCLSFAYPEYRMAEKRKKQELLLIQFRDLLYSISASMALGRSMKQALTESKDFWKNIYTADDLIMKEVNIMLREMDETNENEVKVLRDFAARSELPDVMDFVNVFESARATGGNMPKAIARATALIGEKISLEKELKLALKEKMAEGRIVGLAPVLMVMFMRFFSPGYMNIMYESAAGNLISAFSLLLTVIAVIMIEKINRIDL